MENVTSHKISSLSDFQSFIGGIVSYKALPRSQFSQLQQKLTPVYFGLQTVFTSVLALTYPGSQLLGIPSGLRGTLAESNRWSVLIPLATTLVTSVANWAFVGPATTKIMKDRKHQGMRIEIYEIALNWTRANTLTSRNPRWKEILWPRPAFY